MSPRQDCYEGNCSLVGHLRVEDGIMVDGTKLWHCQRCGMGVRAPVKLTPKRGPWPLKLSVAALLLNVFLALLLLAIVALRNCASGADEVPPWVMRGLLHVETSSYYDGGRIVYVNQRRGRAGEVGAFQATPATLRLYGFSPSLFEQDTVYAERVTRAILSRYRLTTGTWFGAVAAWNCGLAGRERARAIRYATQVSIAGGEG